MDHQGKPIRLHCDVQFQKGGGLDKFIIQKRHEIKLALEETVRQSYQIIREQLAPHLEGKNQKRGGGDLHASIYESEAQSLGFKASVNPDVIPNPKAGSPTIAFRGRRVLKAGIGHIPTLEHGAPYWKYLEYGTYEMGQGEWGGPPYRPGDSPNPQQITPAAKTAKGVAPNRAWRRALWESRIILNKLLVDYGFRKGG